MGDSIIRDTHGFHSLGYLRGRHERDGTNMEFVVGLEKKYHDNKSIIDDSIWVTIDG